MGGHGLVLLNKGRASTCVRPQKKSIVDITMVSPSAARGVSRWHVVDDLRGETLSDHRYVEVVLGTACQSTSRLSTEERGGRARNAAPLQSWT